MQSVLRFNDQTLTGFLVDASKKNVKGVRSNKLIRFKMIFSENCRRKLLLSLVIFVYELVRDILFSFVEYGKW